VVLNDGAAHAVDSNELAFRLAAIGGFRSAYLDARPAVLEPVMKVGAAGRTRAGWERCEERSCGCVHGICVLGLGCVDGHAIMFCFGN
jgi:hypothetical protein